MHDQGNLIKEIKDSDPLIEDSDPLIALVMEEFGNKAVGNTLSAVSDNINSDSSK